MMTIETRRIIGAMAMALGLAALCFILILTALHGVGTDDKLYYQLQMEAGILPEAGISEDDLKTLDAALANYLAGQPDALQMELNVNGTLQSAFNEKELAHLADCFDLFTLLRKVRRRLIPWAVLLAVGGAYLLADRRRIRRVAWLSPLILLIPLGAFAIWAVVDFDGAFTFFHRALFSNDLWLLDPDTDLLIRICPVAMFMGMGLRVGLWSLAALVGVPALVTLVTLIWPKMKQNEANPWNDNRATRRASAQRPKTFDVGGKR